MVQALNVPIGVAVNRYGIGNDEVERFCEKNGLPIVARIPNDIKAAQAYSVGSIVANAVPDVKKAMKDILDWIDTTQKSKA